MKLLTKTLSLVFILIASYLVSYSQKNVVDNNCKIPFKLKYEKLGVIYLPLEPKQFRTPKLSSLFLCLSENRSKLAFLKIIAVSDEEQLDKLISAYVKDLTDERALDTPPTVVFKKGWKPKEPPPPGYYRAVYLRYKSEYFQFSPDPQKWEMQTVILREKPSKN